MKNNPLQFSITVDNQVLQDILMNVQELSAKIERMEKNIEKNISNLHVIDDEKLLTAVEARKILKCSRVKQYYMDREKELVPIYIGRRKFYKKKNIIDYIDKKGG